LAVDRLTKEQPDGQDTRIRTDARALEGLMEGHGEGGIPTRVPLTEADARQPINPYGHNEDLPHCEPFDFILTGG
jgi:hypothetical protein